MSYEIFTDSTANLPNQIIERFKLNVIPVPVIVNGEITYSYEKDGKNDLKVFYDRLRKKESISTSCINEEAFAEAFEKTLEKGSDILYVAFSSALSVTCANGKAVAQRLAEKYPERKIFVVDSLGASMGEGLMVYHACTLKENGQSIEEVRDWLEKTSCVWRTGLPLRTCIGFSRAAESSPQAICWQAYSTSSRSCTATTRGV